MNKRITIEVPDASGKYVPVAYQEVKPDSSKDFMNANETYDTGIQQYERTLLENRLEDIKEELKMARKLRKGYINNLTNPNEAMAKLLDASIKELTDERKSIKKELEKHV